MNAMVQGVQIAVIGMAVVFFALTVISFILSYFDTVDRLLHRSSAKPEVTKMPAPAAASVFAPSDELSPELIAVISAAVSVAIEQKVQIKYIRYRRQPADTTWAVQGRATVMGSHAIKPEGR